MGFPVGYTELLFPKLLLHILSLLGFLRKLICALFRFMGLHDFLEPDIAWPEHDTRMPEFESVSAVLIREILPVVKFRDLVDPPESCAVCLSEFDENDEIRRLANCRHIFHRGCLDRWIRYDQRTCPLCRTPFIPDDMQGAFIEKLWAASGIPELYAEYPHNWDGSGGEWEEWEELILNEEKEQTFFSFSV
ncbi:E3 ubiquitin-protein ligase RHA1B, partial [Mucuna pruriens]